MKILAIDVDGTLTGNELECEIYSEWLGREVSSKELTDYDVTKVLGINKELEKLKWLENAAKFYRDVEVDEVAVNKIMKLVSCFDHVIILTKRYSWGSIQTEEWLNKHNVKYDRLVCTNEYDKLHFIDAYGVTAVVEDNPYFTRELREKRKNIKTYLVARPYNSPDDCDVYIEGSFS
ncbi:hypothetical protein [Enterococcus wangshanyuanii]|uniref:Nucleotidase YqfW n=1 Tax=Enterococcus wangshanyuanii TaxID=2005703 RepID=A0ABQ1PCZ0_9ENTE|nr:hypothetical protein [Enterococcus wangshanyuanii]GGC94779.1 putative nucleotidase YqfW [Enterococcus wangshanyuanii]